MQDLLNIYRTLLDTTDLLASLRDEGLHRDTQKLVDHETARLSQHIFHIEKLAYARVVALVCTHGADLVIEQADLVDAIREGESDTDLNLATADEITMLVETFGSDCVCDWADAAEQYGRVNLDRLLASPELVGVEPDAVSHLRKLFGVSK